MENEESVENLEGFRNNWTMVGIEEMEDMKDIEVTCTFLFHCICACSLSCVSLVIAHTFESVNATRFVCCRTGNEMCLRHYGLM